MVRSMSSGLKRPPLAWGQTAATGPFAPGFGAPRASALRLTCPFKIVRRLTAANG
jgi:hypothetical protein